MRLGQALEHFNWVYFSFQILFSLFLRNTNFIIKKNKEETYVDSFCFILFYFFNDDEVWSDEHTIKAVMMAIYCKQFYSSRSYMIRISAAEDKNVCVCVHCYNIFYTRKRIHPHFMSLLFICLFRFVFLWALCIVLMYRSLRWL